MFDPQYFKDHDKYFLSNCQWQRYNISVFLHTCFISGELLWLKPAFKASITVRQGDKFVEVARWYSEEYALWYLLTNGGKYDIRD